MSSAVTTLHDCLVAIRDIYPAAVVSCDRIRFTYHGIWWICDSNLRIRTEQSPFELDIVSPYLYVLVTFQLSKHSNPLSTLKLMAESKDMPYDAMLADIASRYLGAARVELIKADPVYWSGTPSGPDHGGEHFTMKLTQEYARSLI